MKNICLDITKASCFLAEGAVAAFKPQVKAAQEALENGTCPGNDFLGWLHLPSSISPAFLDEIQACANTLRQNCEVVVVAGIGGSYLGARAVIEMLGHSFANTASKKVRKSPIILFCGNSISATYLADMMDIIEGKNISLNIISKSGTTTEPAIEEGYETFVVPDDVGGRFSVLTAVGLLPIAVAGIDIKELMKGAKDASKEYKKMPLAENPCYQYAAVRNCLLRSGYSTEVMVNYEPSFHYMTEWWKQLYGESEGKDLRGIFPAGVDNTTDLHSMGQFIQDGARIMFETVVNIDQARRSFEIPNDPANLDGLNFLSGMDMNEVNKKAMQGTVLAHVDGGVPNMAVHMPAATAYDLGNLIYFFEKACGISGYLLAVNPFNQPGVEAYKKNMFALLGKPGYEDQKAALEARL